MDASLRIPSDKVSSCEVELAEDNVLKTSFEAGLTNGFLGLCSIDVVTRPVLTDWLSRLQI